MSGECLFVSGCRNPAKAAQTLRIPHNAVDLK